jgi:hypothetical protein
VSGVTVQRGRDDRPELDLSWQSFQDRPYGDDDGETVYATDPEAQGQESTEGQPITGGVERPDGAGQTTFDDWGWSR